MLIFLCSLLFMNAGNVADHPQQKGLDAWLASPGPWIRVGLKDAQKQPRFFHKGTLLVLDGDRVVDTIRPNGSFYVIRGQGRNLRNGPWWVQIKAGRNRQVLDEMMKRMVQRHSGMDFVVTENESGLWVLRIGPLNGKVAADAAREKMVSDGFRDAFTLRPKVSAPFQWVDEQFDKYDLEATELGLVALDPNDPITFSGDGYRGMLRFRQSGSEIRVINILPMETYLRGVVPTELGPMVFPELEALKAQAVAARTYALKNMGRFNSRGYDICDGPACQAYQGVTNEHELSDQAVLETKGMVMAFEGELIDALYTSTCGGETDDVGMVFPGRNEPYLKGRSSYIGSFKAWSLPQKNLPTAADGLPADLAQDAVFYGLDGLPRYDGDLDAALLNDMLQRLRWLLGEPAAVSGAVNHKVFWRTVAALPFFKQVAARQISENDFERALKGRGYDDETAGLAAFLMRYRLGKNQWLEHFDSTDPVSIEEAISSLLTLAKALGPELDWRRYKLERIEGDKMIVGRSGKEETLNLSSFKYYLTGYGNDLVFVDSRQVEELDRIYTPLPPFRDDILRFEPVGTVASVDRFSSLDTWIEKKDIDTLEARARRYVSGLRGLKEIKILKRSDTGRVTLMELIADSGTYKVDGLRIRWSMGIRENLFDMLPAYQNGRLVHVTFVGRGWGHGVGMSQVGAFGLARMGWTYDKILKHYYTGVEILPWSTPIP